MTGKFTILTKWNDFLKCIKDYDPLRRLYISFDQNGRNCKYPQCKSIDKLRFLKMIVNLIYSCKFLIQITHLIFGLYSNRISDSKTLNKLERIS